jgi:hypothetical protein
MGAPVRKYRLYIGYVKELDDKANVVLAGTGENTKTIDMQSLPTDKNFLLLENFQMKASIHFPKEGSSQKNPQQTIEIINPSKETAAYIKTGNVVVLEAGYTDDATLPLICATQIIRSTLQKKGDTTTLKLTCADAYKVKRKTRINRSFPAQFTYAQAVESITGDLATYGIASVLDIDSLRDKQLGKARVFNDTIFEALTDLLQPVNYKWHMAAGQLYIEPKDKKVEDSINVLIVTDDNIKNSVEDLQDTSKKDLAESKENGKGVRLTVNLNGNVSKSDGVRLNISDKEKQGQYLITDVKHTLDYEGSAWNTVIECKR